MAASLIVHGITGEGKILDKLAVQYNAKHSGGVRGCWGTLDFKTAAEAKAAQVAINRDYPYLNALTVRERQLIVNQNLYDKVAARDGVEEAVAYLGRLGYKVTNGKVSHGRVSK